MADKTPRARNQITASVLLPMLASRWRPVGSQPPAEGFFSFCSLVISPVLTPNHPDLWPRLWSLAPRVIPPVVTPPMAYGSMYCMSMYILLVALGVASGIRCVRAEQARRRAPSMARRRACRHSLEKNQILLNYIHHNIHIKTASLRQKAHSRPM